MKTVMFIRHAEKPDPAAQGVEPDGTKSKRDLTPRGWQRAGALVRLFEPHVGTPLRPGLVTPVAVFASEVENDAKSRRPLHTVTPLADALGVVIDHDYGADDEPKLVRRVMDVPGPALVSWHHECIPKLVGLFAPGVAHPPKWPDMRFDMVWVLTQADDGAWSFSQVPQLLLAGDSPNPIA